MTPDVDVLRQEMGGKVMSQAVQYDLLAVPVVDHDHVFGIVTVDNIIDAIVQETTGDVQKFGGMAANSRLVRAFESLSAVNLDWLLLPLEQRSVAAVERSLGDTKRTFSDPG